MSRRSLWVRSIALAALAILAVEQTIRHGWDYVWPDKFLVVEPGRIYRGAWQHHWPMKSIVASVKTSEQ